MNALTPGTSKMAFIGLGVMGRSMAMNLISAGYALKIYTRSKDSAGDVLAAGAEWAESAGAAAQDVDAVVTIVGYPSDVEAIYLADEGIVAQAAAGTLLIDMTTSDPSLAVRIATAAGAQGQQSLDAPVSGGDVGAREARLSIMVGGEAAAFERAQPIFDTLGQTIVHQGPAGTGQHTKMCNQITIASNMIGIMEALVYACRAGLDPDQVLKSIGTGAAGSWSLNNLLPRVINGDYEPGFYVRHFIKDMEIALAEAEKMKVRLPGLDLARRLYEDVVKLGGESYGTQALYMVYDNN